MLTTDRLNWRSLCTAMPPDVQAWLVKHLLTGDPLDENGRYVEAVTEKGFVMRIGTYRHIDFEWIPPTSAVGVYRFDNHYFRRSDSCARFY